MAFTFDKSKGNEEKCGTLFQTYGWGFTSGMGKEAEGKSGGWQIGDSRAVADEAGSVSCVGVAKRPELFVVAGDEGGAGMDPTADIDEAAIQAQAEFGHRIGFVDVWTGEELHARGAEDFLRVVENETVVVAASGDIEQSDQNALGTGANGVVEVSGNTLAAEYGSNVGTSDLGEDGGNRFNRDGSGLRITESREHAGTPWET